MLEVIREIFNAALPSSSAKEPVFVCIPEAAPEDALNDGRDSTQISKEIFPEDCNIHELSASQTFIDDYQTFIHTQAPQSLIVCPPLIASRDLTDSLRKDFPKIDLPSIILQKSIQLLPAGSLLGIVLPQNFGASLRDTPTRKQLVENADIKFVISLNKDHCLVPAFHHSMAFCILVLETGKPNNIPTKFFKLPSEQASLDSAKVLKDFRKLIKQAGGQTQHGYGYAYRKALEPGDKIVYEKYHPNLLAKQAAVGDYGSTTLLKDICQLKVGPINTTHAARKLIIDDSQTGTPVIDAREIRSDGTLQTEETRYKIQDSEAAGKHLNPGDICIRKVIGPVPQLIFAEVTADMPPMVASDKVIVMTIHPEISSEDRELILAFLGSDFPPHWLSGEGAHLWLFPSLLESLPVPLLDEDLKNACRSLSEAADQFDQWKVAAEKARSSLFDFGVEFADAQDSRLLLLQAGRDIRQRQEAAKLVDNFDYRVRTRFPYPVAYKWRIIQSAYPDLEGYVHILECAEILACYIAQVSIMVCHQIEVKLGYLTTIAEKFSAGSGGVSMGDWVGLLREASVSKRIRNYGIGAASKNENRIPFYEFIAFLSTEADSLLDRLKNRRNDNAHGRGPKGAQVSTAYREALQELEKLLSCAEFLSDYPLRYVEETHRDSLNKVTNYRYRDVMGDNALVPLQKGQTQSAELEAKSLYLVDRDGELYLLRPLLRRLRCPECDIWSTFFLENYSEKSDVVTLKSLEHEHSFQRSGLSDAFRSVGLLNAV